MINSFKVFKSNGVLAAYVDSIEEALSSCERNKGWYFEKKGKLTKEEINYKVVRDCINKELEPYGFTYNDIKIGAWCEFFKIETFIEQPYFFGLFKFKKKVIKSKYWYQHLTFESEQNFNEWKEFCINLFRKELKMSKKAAEVEFDWFNLKCGLKQNYEVK